MNYTSTKKNRFFSLIFLSFCINIQTIFAQDAQNAHFLATPLSLNPALTGTTEEGRFLFNYRSQWAKLPGDFVTYQTSYDQNLPKIRSGIGVFVLGDRAGSAGVKNDQIQLSYAYDLRLNSQAGLRMGVQVGYGNRYVDYYKLIFGDQLTAQGFTGNNTQETAGLRNLNVGYFDTGAGMVLYGEKLFLGLAVHHLNQPNISWTGGEGILNRKISLQGGYKSTFRLRQQKNPYDYTGAIIPNFQYIRQGDFQMLNLGLQCYLDPLIVGFSYKDIPISKGYGGAFVSLLGFQYVNMVFMYSYETGLGGFAQFTGGGHEVSFILKTDKVRPKYRRKGSKKYKTPFPNLLY